MLWADQQTRRGL